MNTTYALTGLHCGACVQRLTQALKPFAADVKVTLSPMQATLTEVRADLAQLQDAVRAAGQYDLLPMPDFEKKQAPALVKHQEFAIDNGAESPPKGFLQTYRPLLMILAYILAASIFAQWGQHAGHGMAFMHSISLHDTMRYFMAGFFIAFSFFKMLDLRAFADAYAGYDLLAARWHGWGYVYPFVELALGLAYLANIAPVATAWVTLLVMGFSSIGVIQAVWDKRRIRCACLGTVFQLPMSTVTIVEDVGMVLMAAWMLLT